MKWYHKSPVKIFYRFESGHQLHRNLGRAANAAPCRGEEVGSTPADFLCGINCYGSINGCDPFGSCSTHDIPLKHSVLNMCMHYIIWSDKNECL